MDETEELIRFDPPDTSNTLGITAGQNMPNNSAALRGEPKYVTSGVYARGALPIFRRKQEVYRIAAWLVVMADHLESQQEPGGHTFEQILEAIRNA